MNPSVASALRDSSNRAILGTWILFSFIAVAIAVVGILVFHLIKSWLGHDNLDTCMVGTIAMIVAAAYGLLIWRMAPWLSQGVKFQLQGHELKRVCIGQDIWGKRKKSSETYDLSKLILAQEISKETPEPSTDQLKLNPRQLLLGFKNGHTLLLSRASVTRSIKKPDNVDKSIILARCKKELEEELVSWNNLCQAIEDQSLPRALADIWRSLSPSGRYRLMLQQAEIAFLQAQATPFQTCLASLRSVRDWATNLSKIVRGAFLIAVVASAVLVGIQTAGEKLGSKFDFNSEQAGPWLFAILGMTMGLAIIVITIEFFQPLSARVQQDTLRESIAGQLLRSQVLKDDFDPIVKFAKDDLERIQADATRYTVLTALTGALTHVFNQKLELWASAGLLVLIASVFVLIQLYHYTQMQILRLASTVCLIAQSHAPAKTSCTDDYSMD